MKELFKTFSDYHRETDFLNFQNKFAKQIYESLDKSYKQKLKEPNMVSELCKVANGKNYKNMKFYTGFIHGNYNSGVSFYNKNEAQTKELADMVIISIATENDNVVFEKIAFIQNKKEDSSNEWKIEPNQLYLLQNFPNFTDNTGKITNMAKNQEVNFSNYSETLGNYGLFQSPGEMILINALDVFKLQQKNKISFDDIKKYPFNHNKDNYGYNYMLGEEMIRRYFKYYLEFGLPFPFFNFPFLNNTPISYNIYDFVRNWTLFNIGEVVISHYRPLNKDLVAFSRALINRALKDKLPDDKLDNLFVKAINNEYLNKDEYYKFDNWKIGNTAVLLNIIEIDKERNG